MPHARLIVALLLLLPIPPAAAAWRPPVPGPLTRSFSVTANPFEAGQHRGVDLRAAPGAPVRAPCGGRVVVAGRVGTSGGVVTLLCGHWRVTHLPLVALTVHAGTSVGRGAHLGTLAQSTAHAGLHLGVRRDGTRFGYVDPLRFLTPAPTTPAPPLGRAPRGHRTLPPLGRAPRGHRAFPPPHLTLTRPATAPRRFTAPHQAPVTAPPAPASGPAPGGLAPWPAWVGLALVLAGAGVGRARVARTRTRRRVLAAVRLNE